ncbi:MAG: sigma-70 family RNA polymerase sigma factor [Gemmatimonadota bacterium]
MSGLPVAHECESGSISDAHPRRSGQRRSARSLGFRAAEPARDATRDGLFIERLPEIDELTRSALCRGRGLHGPDADDFAAWVRLRLLEDDARILRAFGGRSTWRTYLRTVIWNLYRDFLDLERGKWRPCTATRRLGAQAVKLSRLMNRDGLSLSAAVAVVTPSGADPDRRRALTRVAAQLPHRPHRRFERLEELRAHGNGGPTPESELLQREEGCRQAERARQLEHAIETLPLPEQLLVRLRFWEDMKVSEIARTMGWPQKPLYRQLARLLEVLRARMEQVEVAQF